MNFVLAHKDALKSLQVYYSTLPFVLFWLEFTNIFTLAPLSVSLSIYVPLYLLLWTLAPCSLALVPNPTILLSLLFSFTFQQDLMPPAL